MHVRITHLDGKLPNLALMRLSAWHRSQGHHVHFHRSPLRELGEPRYDAAYASAIFGKTLPQVEAFLRDFPDGVVGGTYRDYGPGDPEPKVADHVPDSFEGLDYSIYPEYTASLGFTQRGCRFRCAFCSVPEREGRPQVANRIAEIWRGPGHPKRIHILDNDLFGGPAWRDRIAEIREGGFKVCINQGINVRVISDEAAAALASIEYRDDSFTRRRLYTAWDNVGDERVFFRGIDRLEAHGIPARNVMAYMLVGYDPEETWERIWHRFHRMVERGIKPYVMPYDQERADLRAFERWTNRGLYRIVRWEDYRVSHKTSRHGNRQREDLFEPIPPS